MDSPSTDTFDREREYDEYCQLERPHSPETKLELDVEKTIFRIGASGGMMAVGQTLVSMGYTLLGKPLVVVGILAIIYFVYRFLVKEQFVDQLVW